MIKTVIALLILFSSAGALAATKAYINVKNESSSIIQTKQTDQHCMHNGHTGDWGKPIAVGAQKNAILDSTGGLWQNCNDDKDLSFVDFFLYTGKDKSNNGFHCKSIMNAGLSTVTCKASGRPSFVVSVEGTDCHDAAYPCAIIFTDF